MFDKNMNLTTNASNATVYVYNVAMNKLIKGLSSTNIVVSKVST